MQSSKILLKDGQTVDLVDGRIADGDIASWNNKLNVDGSNATNAGVTTMMKQVSTGSDELNDDSTYFGDSNIDHTHIVRRPILNLWNYIKNKVQTQLLGSVGSADKPIYLENGIPKIATGVSTKTDLNNLTDAVNNHTTEIGQIEEDVVGIKSSLTNKKDKQSANTFNGSSTKTVKTITQDVNGELNVEFENIDYPDYKISSSDVSINVSTSEGVTDLTLPNDVVRDSNYVHIDGATEVPLIDGNASAGVSTKYAREDHIHPTDTSREAIANKTTVILGTSDIKYPTDKAVAEFVNSSIATNTANYISNNGVPFISVEQLNAYTGTVTNNDYAFVTGTDSEGNTYYDRYKATVSGSTVTWALEYRLNNSSFTAAQWAAINSGVTSDKANYWDRKQDALTFDGTYNGSTNKAATVATVANAINALDVTDISGFGAGKTLATMKEENGKISATFQNISITKSQVSDFSHTHGNIQNGGTLQTNDITIANGDKLVVTDASDSNKVARASLTFDGATTNQMLSKKGEWSDTIAKARAVVDYGATSKAIEIGWGGKSVQNPTYFAVYTDSANGYNKAIKDCSLENAKKAINGTSVGSNEVPIFINANGAPQVCTLIGVPYSTVNYGKEVGYGVYVGGNTNLANTTRCYCTFLVSVSSNPDLTLHTYIGSFSFRGDLTNKVLKNELRCLTGAPQYPLSMTVVYNEDGKDSKGDPTYSVGLFVIPARKTDKYSTYRLTRIAHSGFIWNVKNISETDYDNCNTVAKSASTVIVSSDAVFNSISKSESKTNGCTLKFGTTDGSSKSITVKNAVEADKIDGYHISVGTTVGTDPNTIYIVNAS